MRSILALALALTAAGCTDTALLSAERKTNTTWSNAKATAWDMCHKEPAQMSCYGSGCLGYCYTDSVPIELKCSSAYHARCEVIDRGDAPTPTPAVTLSVAVALNTDTTGDYPPCPCPCESEAR
jgi:hypothetical protein